MSLVERAQDIRARLMNPANAVADTPIDLNRPKPGIERRLLRLTEPPKPAPIVIPPPVSRGDLAGLEAQIKRLSEQMGVLLVRYDACSRDNGQPSIRDIQESCAKFYRVTLADILSEQRTSKIVRARQVAVYLCKVCLGRPFKDLSRQFNKDRTTVMHAVQKIQSLAESDGLLKSHLDRIMAKLSLTVTSPL